MPRLSLTPLAPGVPLALGSSAGKPVKMSLWVPSVAPRPDHLSSDRALAQPIRQVGSSMNASCVSTHSTVYTSLCALTLTLLFPLLSLAQSTHQGDSLAPVVPAVPAFTLEDGTPVKLRLSRTISSAEESVGNEVDFDVLEEVRIG